MLQGCLSLFFKLLYTQFAFLYNIVAWTSSIGQWRQWQTAALVHFKPGVILELGHGPGYGQLELKQAGYTSIALDPSHQMNRLAQRRLKRAGYRADIVRGKAQSLPFLDQSLSAVVSIFPSEYILDPQALQETWRVLSPGGSLTIVGLVEITGKSLPDRLARWLFRVTGQSGSISENWADLFKEQGFIPKLEPVEMQRARVTRVVALRP